MLPYLCSNPTDHAKFLRKRQLQSRLKAELTNLPTPLHFYANSLDIVGTASAIEGVLWTRGSYLGSIGEELVLLGKNFRANSGLLIRKGGRL